jgi:glycosyltransferase involved in cell wall biosynthesis
MRRQLVNGSSWCQDPTGGRTLLSGRFSETTDRETKRKGRRARLSAPQGEDHKSPDLALLYFGAFAPDRPEYQNPAVSVAGNLFQRNFLAALAESDLPNPEIHSYFPVVSFPRSRKLFCGSRTERLDGGLSVRSLPHVNLGALKILSLGAACFWRALAWGLKNRRASERVVLAYNLTAPPAWPIALACRMLKMRFVPFIGDIYVPGEVVKDTLLRRIEFASQKSVLPEADGLLIANQAILDDFAPDRRALLVEGGVDRAFLERFRQAKRLSDGCFRIVFAGQLSELNGVTLLLEALRLNRDPNLRATILGGGAYEADVRAAAEADPRIEFLGRVPHERVLVAYENADLVLNLRRTHFRTQRYVFPSKVVECLATGRPLLSTGTGHMQSEFGDFVFLLEEETPEALAEMLRDLAAVPAQERESVGRRAQEYAAKHKTWDAHARKLGEYLEDHVFTKEAA